MRGGAIPTRSGTMGGGFSSGSRPPTFSTSPTSSISWPDGSSKRIDSPWPTSWPAETRSTAAPAAAALASKCSRSSGPSTLKAKRSMPTRGASRMARQWWSRSSQHFRNTRSSVRSVMSRPRTSV